MQETLSEREKKKHHFYSFEFGINANDRMKRYNLLLTIHTMQNGSNKKCDKLFNDYANSVVTHTLMRTNSGIYCQHKNEIGVNVGKYSLRRFQSHKQEK